jgi:hypothetical protein
MHLVEGTFNATRHKDRVDEPKPTGKVVKPKFLRGRASALWDEYSAIGYWLTAADSHALAIWCGLGAEAEKSIAKMPASRISTWKGLGAELGFLPGSRTRINVGAGLNAPPDTSSDQEDEFFAPPPPSVVPPGLMGEPAVPENPVDAGKTNSPDEPGDTPA